ncbi:DUF2141 domain-containing protein [Arundinibacter roseus]|uniref:DUF2141 domain-containing protein n=1 Tax=Arundinibacter roseus TaxID=2070510 RepID=A0A4R4KBE7_9BACT|nr:DUF2141 domain-containing protein [Arundinibacter roseus]TDB64072.1 DUF2141 domain-containing protein [Arundinibacter roseus]
MLKILIASLLIVSTDLNQKMAKLTVEITNIRHPTGQLRVGVYKPSNTFGKAKPDYNKIVDVKAVGSQKVVLDVEPGTYAVALYHDVNNNQALDKNMIGYPKEPFGFSNNYRPIVSGPDFKDCAFEISEAGKTISIKLIK